MSKITEKDYKEIARTAYKFDPDNYKSEQQIKIGDSIDINGRQFQVIDAIGNSAEPTENSMQAMAVAPVDNQGNVDYSQVVVSYVGTNFGDKKDVLNDIENLGMGFTDKMITGLPSISGMGKGILEGHFNDSVKKEVVENIVDVQSKTALEFAQRVEKKVRKENPNAIITTNGHSLGESMALYTALKMGWNNVGFNGPDIHNIVSEEEIAYMQAHPEQFRNFRNPNDMFLGNILGNKTGVAIYVNMTDASFVDESLRILQDDKLSWKEKADKIYSLGDKYHSYNTWRFNNKGQLIDENGNVVTNTAKGNANALILETKTRMLRYYGMKSLLTESGGGLSSNERIFLDSEQATIGANALVNAAQQVLDQIKIEKQRGVEEVESLFETTKSPFMVSSLSPDEIRSAFAAGGVTHDSVVGNVEISLQNKLNKASQILDEMTKLKDKIAAGINKKLEEDIALAGEFNQWRNLK